MNRETSRIKLFAKLFRVKHWTKNLIVFLPVVYSLKFRDLRVLTNVAIGFIAFSLLSSAIYVTNDIRDAKNDKNNPKKRNRPIASGQIKKSAAALAALVLLAGVAVLGSAYRFPACVWLCMILYLAINLAYSFGAKNIPLIDISILSAGYVIRLYVGGLLAETGVSAWMFLTVLSGAMYLAIGKRKNELNMYGADGRPVLRAYKGKFLENSSQMFKTLTILFYALCCADETTTIGEHGIKIIWSVPVVILIFLRYDMRLEEDGCDGDPVEVLYKDIALMGLSAFYCVSVLIMFIVSL